MLKFNDNYFVLSKIENNKLEKEMLVNSLYEALDLVCSGFTLIGTAKGSNEAYEMMGNFYRERRIDTR